MAAKSKIEWTDATVNFWWGCTKVGPGCDFCYAETFDKRVGGDHWGLNKPRRKINGAVALIHQLDNDYAECARGNARAFGLPGPNVANTRRVFIQSMSDLFDLEVSVEWFAEAWQHIEACDRIDIQIVTKRVSVVEKRLAQIGRTSWPRHAGLIITVTNQDEADRDIPRLLALKAKFNIPWVGLSIEPMLGPIDILKFLIEPAPMAYQILSEWYGPDGFDETGSQPRRTIKRIDPCPLQWVICGGESGPHARPMHPDWARSLRDQCAAAGVPFFFKQWGEWCPDDGPPSIGRDRIMDGTVRCAWWKDGTWRFEESGYSVPLDRAKDSGEWVYRLGKKRAGRLLDGIEHNGFPKRMIGHE